MAHMTRFLVKIPSRERPARLLAAVGAWQGLAGGDVEILLSLDRDDEASLEYAGELQDCGATIRYGDRYTKVEAFNRDISDFDFDVLVVASDDFVPMIQGWDDHISRTLDRLDTEDIALWCPDARQDRICTIPVMTRKYFDRDGYVFHPSYRSYFCDDEWTTVARMRAKLERVPGPLFLHNHPAFTRVTEDDLYRHNRRDKALDRANYIRRREANFGEDLRSTRPVR